jgi:hypothetical protein
MLIIVTYNLLDRFFIRGFSGRKKGHQRQLWRVTVDGLGKSSGGSSHLKNLYFFYRISPEKSTKGGDFIGRH